MPSSGGTIYLPKWTSYSSGVPFTLAGSPVVSIYKDNDTTQSTAGVTLIVNFDSITGLNHVSIDTSADLAFYANGHSFSAVITTGTVNSVSAVGQVVGSFDLVAALGPVAGGVTLANGVVHGGTTASLLLQLIDITNPSGIPLKIISENSDAAWIIGGHNSGSGGNAGYGVIVGSNGGRPALFLAGGFDDGAAAPGLAMLGGTDGNTVEITSQGAGRAINILTNNAHGVVITAVGADNKALLLASDAAIDSLAIAAGSNPPVNIFSELGGVTLANGVTHGGNAAILSLAQITVTAAAASDNAAFILRGDGSGAGFDVKGGITGAGFDIQGGGTSGNAISVTGIHGHGIRVLGGSTGSWNGITIAAGSSTNSAAITATGNGSGPGLNLQGGATGDALDLFGGSTSGFGIFAQSHGTDCARWVVQSGNGDAFSGIGHGTGVGFRSSAAAVGFGGGTVDANIVSSAINVPCILANGVAHGGPPGSSTATFAMQAMNITNPSDDAVKFISNASNKYGLNVQGNYGAIYLNGGAHGDGIDIDAPNGSGIYIGASSAVGSSGIFINSEGVGIQSSSNSAAGLTISSQTSDAMSIFSDAGNAISIRATGANKKAFLLAGDAATDSFAIAAGVGSPIDVFDAEGNVKIKIPGI